MKILILRFSSGGDLILLTGIIDKLLKKNIEVFLVIKKKFKNIFDGFENLKILELEKEKEILKQSFDYAVDLQKNLKSFFLMKKIKAKKKLYANKRSLRRRLYLFFRFPLKEKSFIKIFSEPFEKIFNEDFYVRPILKGEKEFKGLPEKYILIAPFSSKGKKNLKNKTLKKILEIKSKENFCVIVGDEKSKKENLPFLNDKIIDLRGKTDLNELFYIVKNSSFVITVDSMVSHIASAYKKSGVVFFGPTTFLYGFRPYGDELKIIYNKTFCSPCSLHGEGICLFNKRCYNLRIFNNFIF
ncbi:MAG: glycosyltransferase family 9 protein [candidate division WOR-3 bacterium]